MPLRNTPGIRTSRPVLQACAIAIRALEKPEATFKHNDIEQDDYVRYRAAKKMLWAILQDNNKIIDTNTNRLKENH
jgi:hypothetical protein